MSPMGKYKDFAQCVRMNKDKNNPQAYCGDIYRKVEGRGKRKGKVTKEAFVRAAKKT